MNVWSCDLPGCPGKTIGSSLLRWLKRQPLTKLTPRSRTSDSAFCPTAAFVAAAWANERTPLSEPDPADAAAAATMPVTPSTVLTSRTTYRLIEPPVDRFRRPSLRDTTAGLCKDRV